MAEASSLAANIGPMKLTLFDLDHTLLSGDSDVLWCDYLMHIGVLDRASFEPRNQDMEAQYKAGSVSPQAFCEFYVSTLTGRSAAQWLPVCQDFLRDVVAPRIPASARHLVRQHQAAGDVVVLSTATNRVITEVTAAHLGITHLIATECELAVDGRLSGKTQGTLNMREGKVLRAAQWLAAQGHPASALAAATFYSDSINDLPLLSAVAHPVAVDPDARLLAEATQRVWRVLKLAR